MPSYFDCHQALAEKFGLPGHRSGLLQAYRPADRTLQPFLGLQCGEEPAGGQKVGQGVVGYHLPQKAVQPPQTDLRYHARQGYRECGGIRGEANCVDITILLARSRIDRASHKIDNKLDCRGVVPLKIFQNTALGIVLSPHSLQSCYLECFNEDIPSYLANGV